MFRFRRRRRAVETLRFPLPVPARIAIIDAEFHLGTNMQAFGSGDVTRLLDYAPEALVLPLDYALTLARSKTRLPSVRIAIVVLSSVDLSGSGPLTAHHRDLLWNTFGLPVFEQLRGRDGRVIARECEVHDGMHFDAKAVIEVPPGLSGQHRPGALRLRFRNTAPALSLRPQIARCGGLKRLPLHRQRHRIAAAKTQRRNSTMNVAANHLINQRHQYPGPARANRMANCHRAAVDVDAIHTRAPVHE